MSDLSAFQNEPVLELRRGSVRAGLGEALAAVDRALPIAVPVSVAGETRSHGAQLCSRDPGCPTRVIGEATVTSGADLAAAVDAAQRASAAWRELGARGRARSLLGAAEWMRRHRLELAALEVRECAKPWPEADADVCEAIDFLEFYARGATALEGRAGPLQAPGERNSLRYAPRGVTAVISPWNFPLAIPCGMSAAALATGNPVLLKPAEQSPACALRLVQALRAGGVPDGVISLLPGEGDVGAALVGHPAVATIAFTGSLPVGLGIIATAAQPATGQRQLKRVVAELGGKNCVLVDSDADLDEAVPAIVNSAFAYAGQKCSAASRVLIHEAVYETAVLRIAGAVSVLAVDQAAELACEVPPVIERSAQERVQEYGETAAKEGRIIAGANDPPGPGWFVAPKLVTELPPASRVLSDEVFGPLLALERVRDLDHACELVEDLPFALTGGLFSRNPAAVRQVCERSPVGNLYVNRGITGAMVARQPFGGNRLSGTGTKAGGEDYLLQFVAPQVVSENTMRHGLAI